MGVTILMNRNATGAGLPCRVGMKQRGLGVHCWFTGNLTELTVDIEGRILGSESPNVWAQIGQVVFTSGELSAKTAHRFISDKPVDEVRANVITITGSGNAFCAIKEIE